LEGYLLECEQRSDYEECIRVSSQLDTLRQGEEARRMSALKARHALELSQVNQAHVAQFESFNQAWDQYLAEYNAMAEIYVAHMQEKHLVKIQEFQTMQTEELSKRPAKYSPELLEWRSKEALLVRQRNYVEAAEIKQIADELEARERSELLNESTSSYVAKENALKQLQSAELAGLHQRIEARRMEHLLQRENDSKRLLQRNKNVLSILEARQIEEEQRMLKEVKASLQPPRREHTTRLGKVSTPSAKPLISSADSSPFETVSSGSKKVPSLAGTSTFTKTVFSRKAIGSPTVAASPSASAAKQAAVVKSPTPTPTPSAKTPASNVSPRARKLVRQPQAAA
jgi:hypothetical protein